MKTLKLAMIDMYIQTIKFKLYKIYLFCAVLAYNDAEQSSTDCSAELDAKIRFRLLRLFSVDKNILCSCSNFMNLLGHLGTKIVR